MKGEIAADPFDAKQNDFYAMLNDPGRESLRWRASVANEQRATQFGANPASILPIREST